MANHPSAEKRNRQRLVRTTRNRAVRTALRTRLKAARVAIEGGAKDEAAAATQIAKIALAKAAGKGVIHRNAAARTTSRLDRALSRLS